ncbi:lipopolysaccharide assembly protein LapB [Snodgrassella sp. W8124]|uniref:tetratricopeptide repeat protein n=1 Tax=Snodgrassella sp. W8124 TaxID=2750993 RepID=UPI0018DB67D7|nr:tetratricopeptide repeat protein [Snodgrassella sp. W8124]MBI0129333.1 sel1 repeat family protein [Snodgrassella sp. W8124]
MKDNNINNQIDELSKITREDGERKYADAQIMLGNIYRIKHDYDNAKAFYLNIARKDDPELYAQAQYKLAYIYTEIKQDYDKAKTFLLHITRKDNPELYAQAQYKLAYIYSEIKQDYDKAKTFLLHITRKDNPKLYAQAQYKLAYIYSEIKQDYDKAKTSLLNINKKDYYELYAQAQFNLGYLYSEDFEFDKSEFYYLNITRKNNSKLYAQAQFNMGLHYHHWKQYNKAELFYLKITRKDDSESYFRAQFHLGRIYSKNLKNYTKAKTCFYNAFKVATYSSSSSSYYICTQFIFELMKNNSSLISNEEEFEKLNETLFDKIKDICFLTNDIKNNLLVYNQFENNEQERRVAHYTKPAVLFNLLKGENPSKFRLNIVDFMNDPSENQVLTSWLNISNHPDNEIKSFLASFSFNHNCLNQFRLYGNEDNIVGSGVSIAFNKDFFGLDTERSINNEIISSHSIKSINPFENKQIKFESNNNLHPLPLYRCLYFDPKTGYMALAKRNKQSFYLENKNEKTPEIIDSEWDKYIKSLHETEKISCIRDNLEKIKELIEELSNNLELKKISNLDELLSLAVLPISCLIKHAAFEDEDECRMIYITHIADDNIVEPQDYQSANSLYVEYTHVEEYIDNIYLGPQCKMQHKIWLQNHFKKKRREREIKLIKSEMPLR